MARGGVRRPAALGLALRLLLGFGLGLEAAPTPVPLRLLAQAPGSCPPASFQCRTSGFCVPLTLRCDGDEDCPDGSDEDECRIKPCAQDGECLPVTGSPCPCDNIDDCRDGIVDNVYNCSYQPCPAGELRCLRGGACIPHTWLCDGHGDCPGSSDELGCGTETLQDKAATSIGTSVTPDDVTSLWNATAIPVEDQDSVQAGNRSACGVIAAAVVLSVGVAAISLFVLSRLRAQGRLYPLGLLMVMKESLLLSERKTSLL
ncbi:CD320 antigen isoform X1 [Canis lupus baileyi]|uniref:CD320 molecule n=3 Tax=Canis lupus TaxID=9612 RepID=A0A8P0SMV4_CANLF|nr:CD320 antigen isoform X1 [Canis lupus familiaris]XP_025313075.1 CD320 antigen isoform X1 [Canis lupus dingo]XP_038284745.1 CD320 antigen isoform X1 [Canis lupus familiaris]XP_038423422.1 CD320 antigen isoform X1 [Canis lupus familiaris]